MKRLMGAAHQSLPLGLACPPARSHLPLLRIAFRERTIPVRASVRRVQQRVSALESANVGLDYDRAGERYRAYADGDQNKLYEFDGQYAYGDREVWRIVAKTLREMRAEGARELSVLDLGCGPGTWIRRIVGRANGLYSNPRPRG